MDIVATRRRRLRYRPDPVLEGKHHSVGLQAKKRYRPSSNYFCHTVAPGSGNVGARFAMDAYRPPIFSRLQPAYLAHLPGDSCTRPGNLAHYPLSLASVRT